MAATVAPVMKEGEYNRNVSPEVMLRTKKYRHMSPAEDEKKVRKGLGFLLYSILERGSDVWGSVRLLFVGEVRRFYIGDV